MILNAFRIERDRCTEQESFGYERPLWPWKCRPFHNPETVLGTPMVVHGKLVTNIVKSIELYWKGNEPVVVERLAWMFNRMIFPYRVKYIHQITQLWSQDPIVFLPNMSGIYQTITGNRALFVSPLDYYLDRLVVDPDIASRMRDYAMDLLRDERVRLDGIAAQETDYTTLRDFLTYMDGDCDPRGVETFVLPKLEIADPLSTRYISGGFSTRNLTFAGAGANPFDTSPVGCLPITHPEVTVYSPAEYHSVALMCEDITCQYSDVKIEYILSDQHCILDHRTHQMVSRYLDKVNDAIVSYHCETIVCLVMAIASKSYPDRFTAGNDVLVTLDISYGDEALIEILTKDRRQCLFAVHLDLAMIALCSSGVIAVPL